MEKSLERSRWLTIYRCLLNPTIFDAPMRRIISRRIHDSGHTAIYYSLCPHQADSEFMTSVATRRHSGLRFEDRAEDPSHRRLFRCVLPNHGLESECRIFVLFIDPFTLTKSHTEISISMHSLSRLAPPFQKPSWTLSIKRIESLSVNQVHSISTSNAGRRQFYNTMIQSCRFPCSCCLREHHALLPPASSTATALNETYEDRHAAVFARDLFLGIPYTKNRHRLQNPEPLGDSLTSVRDGLSWRRPYNATNGSSYLLSGVLLSSGRIWPQRPHMSTCVCNVYNTYSQSNSPTD
ncbi:hypothetical protein LZ31DRAFT_43761 [Colletotrichum somersetense]|nr:hypothetical protein LZ31DRAFT_43761 [Colletotrichum somersetense]